MVVAASRAQVIIAAWAELCVALAVCLVVVTWSVWVSSTRGVMCRPCRVAGTGGAEEANAESRGVARRHRRRSESDLKRYFHS